MALLRKHISLALAGILVLSATSQTDAAAGKAEIYHDGWNDLNKNGKMDPYENPKLDVELRIDDLLSRMTVDEKTCQMATLYGYKRVLKDDQPKESWKNEIWKDGIGNIDEHLNSFRGWGAKPMDNPHCWPASNLGAALNEVQRFFIEDTRLGIPVDFTNEGIRGIEAKYATCFPTQLGLGHTWNKDLINKVGVITGREARLLGYTNVYAPILDVIRDQRWGRCEECYGESPFLVGELGVEMVKGLQSQHVVSTPKHFAIYSNNKGAREGEARTDPQTSPREVEQIFLWPFKQAFQRGRALGVMSSYNDYDGVPVSGSEYYLTEKLRWEYGFKGYVVSDSNAVVYISSKHKVAPNYKEAVRHSVQAGLNVRTTFNHPKNFINPLRELVAEGKISQKTLDSRVRDVLRVKYWLGLFDKPYLTDDERKLADEYVNCEDNNQIALQASRESLVLLKNEANTLPLSKELKNIAVIGPNAAEESFAVTHYGPLAVEVTSVLEAIKAKMPQANVQYAKGCDLVDKNWPDSEILPEPLTAQEKTEIEKAVEIAKKSDVAVVVLGGGIRTCGENKSRTSLELPGKQLELIQAIHATKTPVVAVLINGRPLSINWVDKYVPAVIEAWYPGAHGGTAIADVLFGDYNPGGKLTVTFPRTAGQIPMNFPNKPNAQVDMNYGRRARVNGVIYPFGHGLSYTTFKYSNLKISPLKQYPQGRITITCDIENTGKVAGDEVVQLYIRDAVSSVTTYEKSLRGFERISLQPGQKKTVTFTLNSDHLELVDRNNKRVVEPGEFKVMIGASSTNIKLKGSFEILPQDSIF